MRRRRLLSWDVALAGVEPGFAAVAAGDTIRSRDALRVAARERAERERAEREQTAEPPAAGERLRIAQELHDTLGYSLDAINDRSSVARDLGDAEDPAGALEDARKPGVLQGPRLRGEGGAVRGERDVGDPVEVREHRDELLKNCGAAAARRR